LLSLDPILESNESLGISPEVAPLEEFEDDVEDKEEFEDESFGYDRIGSRDGEGELIKGLGCEREIEDVLDERDEEGVEVGPTEPGLKGRLSPRTVLENSPRDPTQPRVESTPPKDPHLHTKAWT
jgi:hypothetical protein